MLVCKFGGSSLADAKQFQKVKDIITRDPLRRYVVPSAPGKRGPGDEKITDLLYACQSAAAGGRNFKHIFERIAFRYTEIAEELQVDFPQEWLDEVCEQIGSGASPMLAASRGEYLSGKLLARYLGVPFVDAAEVIRFTRDGHLDEEKTNELLSARLLPLERAVVPGFYGADEDGRIVTFSRGGSDVSGSLGKAPP